MTVRLFGAEAALFRVAGLIDDRLGPDEHAPPAFAAALEEYAVEASLLKVAASEMLDYAADENVQIHGGNGFVRDYAAERHYRDSRVNRIFEGTNEINRLLVPAMILKRAAQGAVAGLSFAGDWRENATALPPPAGSADVLASARRTVAGLKRTATLLIGLTAERYGERLQDEQEVLMLVSDVLRDAFIADSAILRAAQATQLPVTGLASDAAAVFAHDAGLRASGAARVAIAAMTTGDAQRDALTSVAALLDVPAIDTIAARRRLADAATTERRYVFDAW
jgi:hypothetical protein